MRPRSFLMSIVLLFLALDAWAAALLQSMSGDVRFETTGRAAAVATVNQRFEPGATVHTGANAQALLRFDDGQQVAMSANSSFKIDEFRYDVAKPEQGSVGLSLLKGALRLVTGIVGQRNASKFALNTPTATIGIRGTDFMVALVNPVYMQVIQGSIAATNTVGTVAFAAGSTGMVASATTLAASIAATALPAAVSATFAQLGSLTMAGAAAGASSASSGAAGGGGAASSGAAGASGAAAGAVGGISVGAVAAGVVAVGAVAASASSTTPTTGTTGTTGTQ